MAIRDSHPKHHASGGETIGFQNRFATVTHITKMRGMKRHLINNIKAKTVMSASPEPVTKINMKGHTQVTDNKNAFAVPKLEARRNMKGNLRYVLVINHMNANIVIRASAELVTRKNMNLFIQMLNIKNINILKGLSARLVTRRAIK